MKKIFYLFLSAALLVMLAPLAFAEETGGLKVSGEAKSGIYWQSVQDDGKEADEYIGLHSMDDAGDYKQQGRFRLNMEYENANGFGFKARLNWQNWKDDVPEKWPYAFAYGNFFQNQLTVSVGKLGGSPWGTGGPELWKDLENVDKSGGMRVEYKPGWVPEAYGKINVGFVLNYFNSDIDQGWTEGTINLASILQESMIGLSYIHKYFLVRGAYKFDSKVDAKSAIGKEDGGAGEDEMVYRVEETIINDYVPGLKFWALGYLLGLSAANNEIKLFQNYAFLEYEPPSIESLPAWTQERPFTAQLRFGYDYTDSRAVMHLKPSFYWNFFSKLISVGASLWYGNDFGYTTDNWYKFMEIEPKLQINFQSSYIAFIYNWRREYKPDNQAVPGFEPFTQTQKMNLRFCIYY